MRGLLRLGGAQSSSIETNAGWRRLVRWLPWPAVRLCGTALGCRAVPTRRKPVPGGSRSPSMATRRSAQPCTPERPANSEPLEVKPAAARCRCRCVGTPLIRPFDAMDGINEPPGMGSRRVVAGAYQRRGLHGLTSTRHDTCPVIRRAMSHKKIAHGANRWAIKEPALDPGRTAHFQALHVQNHQVVDHRRAFLPYHMDVALQHHLGAAGQHFHRLDPGT